MKNALQIILIFVVLIIGFILVGTLFLPKSYVVKRERIIPAPADSVFKHISSFKKWETWSPWRAKDPSATYSYNNIDDGVGSTVSWSGNDEVGVGSMEMQNVIVNQEVKYQLSFKKPYESQSTGGLYLDGDSEKTRVQWYDSGECKWPLGRIFGVMADGMLGPDFEQGLANLDSVVLRSMVHPNEAVIDL